MVVKISMVSSVDIKRNFRLAVNDKPLDMPLKSLGKRLKTFQYDREYYQKHRKRLRAYGHKWYWANREKVLKKRRAKRRAARRGYKNAESN